MSKQTKIALVTIGAILLTGGAASIAFTQTGEIPSTLPSDTEAEPSASSSPTSNTSVTPEAVETPAALATLQKFATVSLQNALQAAETYAAMPAYQISLAVDDGNLVYRATVPEQHIYIDAGTAAVLYAEPINGTDGTAMDATDDPTMKEKPRSSIQVSDVLDNPSPR